MTRHAISIPDAPAPGGTYSQAIVANGFLYTAGFGGHDPITGELGEGVAAQTHRAIDTIEAILATQGLDLTDVVKSTVHLQHLDRDFATYDQAYRSRFTAPYPVRTTVGSTLAGILVEIDVVAALRT